MALPSRRRETATARPPAVWEPFRTLDELQRRTAALMRVPDPEQQRPGRVVVQARKA